MRIKKLFSSITRQQTMKIVGFLVIVGLFFALPTTFAQNTDNDSLTKITEFLQNVIALCSRGWVVLAILAGKLMTNDFVYGSFIHMDIYLWKIWNIMKNFANFALVALVLGSIVKNFIGKEAIDVKKIITNTLLAGILIQASWFMMGALVDLSTVATVAISAFPSSFIQSNADMKTTMNNNAQAFNNKRLVINMSDKNLKDGITSIDDSTPNTNTSEDIRKTFLPTSNSISGPFVYMGMGIFQFQKAMSIGTDQNAVTMSLTFALRFMLIVFFTIALLLLFIANIMRIGLLRVFIIGAPFFVLILLFKPKNMDTSKGIGKLFSLPNLLTLVFKPVIFVAGMSIILIIVMSMNTILMDSGSELTSINGISFDVQTGSSSMSLEGISNVTMEQNDLFGKDVLDNGQNSFAMLIVMFLTMFLMWRIVKLSLTLGSGPIEDTMEKMTGRAESMAKSAPVLPFKGGGASFNATKGLLEGQRTKILREGFKMNQQGEFDEAEESFQHMIDDKMNIQSSWSSYDYTKLEEEIKKGSRGNFFGKSTEIGHIRQGGLSLSNSTWKSKLETYLGSGQTLFKPVNTTEKDIFDRYFKGIGPQAATNRWALHESMGGNAHANKHKPTGSNPQISYDQLLENVYTKKSYPKADGTQ